MTDYSVKTILVATDLQPGSAAVLRHAQGLATALGAKVHVLHVLEPLTKYAQSLVDSYISQQVRERMEREGLEESRKELRQKLMALCTEAGLDESERGAVLADLRVESGIPFDVIVKTAQNVGSELVVVGSRGHTALGEMLLGSVAHKVAMFSRVPVLLVPIHH